MQNIVKIALHRPSRQLMHIDQAANGLACDCECLKCGEKLEAIQGEVYTKHFRHHSNKYCTGSQETALHGLGKQILLQNNKIQLPEYGQIEYVNPKAEEKFEEIRPDVIATYENEPLIIEIFVAHPVEKGKEKYIQEKKLKCVEIDLRPDRASTFEEIRNSVLHKIDNKRVIFWEAAKLEIGKPNDNLTAGTIVGALAIIAGLAWLFRKK